MLEGHSKAGSIKRSTPLVHKLRLGTNYFEKLCFVDGSGNRVAWSCGVPNREIGNESNSG